jgi:hypothetical protein
MRRTLKRRKGGEGANEAKLGRPETPEERAQRKLEEKVVRKLTKKASGDLNATGDKMK